MTILTSTEAATVLRTEEHDQNMLDLLPLVDRYLLTATGHDWAADSAIHPAAKAAARMLLVKWHEDPGARESGALSFGLTAALVQLESLALRYKEFEGLPGAGLITLPGAREGDTVASVTGLIGVSGNQSASFETVITMDNYIQQVSSSNLDDTWFRALLTPVSAL